MEVVLRHQQRVPVDVYALAADLGIPVKPDRSLGDSAGKICRDTGGPGFIISVNPKDSRRRQRFTVAHELAHYLLHADMIGDGIVDDAMFRSSMSDYHERQANRLAADILLPKKAVKEAYRRTKGIAPLAEQFDVSADAMTIRLKELGMGA
jgi:hypothetical protein